MLRRRLKGAEADLTDEDLMQLALGLALDQDQWDHGNDASRSRVKLDCLRFLHEVRQDAKGAGDQGAVSDFHVWVQTRRGGGGG
jgi:hypothetical protein